MVAADTPLTGATKSPETSKTYSGSQRKSNATSIVASQIEVKPTVWLWPERVPMNAITVLAGDPGLGKSLLTIALAAKLTRGKLMEQPMNVLMLSAEDSLAHTVRPRLEAADADIGRVHFGSMDRDGIDTSILLPSDIGELSGLVAEKEAGLVVIDPLMAHLAGAVDSWKDQRVRQALAPLHRMAEETGTAVLVVAHLNKGQGDDPLQRLGGSIGIPAAARSVLLLGRDPNDPEGDRRVLAHVKSNVGPLAPSLAFTIDGVGLPGVGVETARISEAGVSPYSGSDLLSIVRRERGAKRAEAVAFLERELRDGPRSVRELIKAANELGISEQTLKRARTELGAQSGKASFDGGWVWYLPDPHDGEARAA